MSYCKDPSVGVFVPAYNAEDFVSICLDSLLDQTYPLSQIVVCDDASTDATPSIIQKYETKYPDRITGILHEENMGIPENFNSGLAEVETDLVSLIAADDRWHPEKIEHEVDRLQANSQARWVYSRSRRIDENGNDLGEFRRKYDGREGDILFEVLTHRMALRNWTAERSLIKEVGNFDESYRIFEDWDLKIRLAAHAPVAFANHETVFYRKRAGSASSSSSMVYAENLERVYKKHGEMIKALPNRERKEIRNCMRFDLTSHYRNWYYESLKKGDILQAIKCYKRIVNKTRSLNVKLVFKILLYPILYSRYSG